MNKTNKNYFTDPIEALLKGKEKNFTTKPIAFAHDFYISGDIGPAEEYIDWIETIRSTAEQDIVRIHINSDGGYVDTAIQLLRAIKEGQGTIICSAEGSCMSAATMIFLSADQYEISDFSTFMFHNYSTGAYGKGGELFDKINFQKSLMNKMMDETYKDILTPDEMSELKIGKDIWLEGPEMAKRLRNRIEKRAEEKEALKKPTKTSTQKKTTTRRKKNDNMETKPSTNHDGN
jgi:ATP-dependent protease ClpP protease subunit